MVEIDIIVYMPVILIDTSQITKFMGPTWGPPGSCRQMGPMLAPWTLLLGLIWIQSKIMGKVDSVHIDQCWLWYGVIPLMQNVTWVTKIFSFNFIQLFTL